MDRRAFLTVFGSGVAGSGLIGTTHAAWAQGEPLVRTYISNLAQTAGVADLPSLGESVLMVRDHACKYDPLSLAVTTRDGTPLGHVPPIHSRIIEPFISSGYEARAWVEASKSSPRPQIRIALVLRPPRTHHV